MITDQDVAKLKKTFVTKDEFKKLENRVDRIEVKLDGMAEQVGDLRVEFAEMKDKMDTFQVTLDGVAGAIQDMRTENNICTAWHQEHARNIKAIVKQGKFKLV